MSALTRLRDPIAELKWKGEPGWNSRRTAVAALSNWKWARRCQVPWGYDQGTILQLRRFWSLC